MAYVFLTDQPIEPAEVSRRVETASCGATLTFLGTVRAQSRGQRVLLLEYEAYTALAEKQMLAIAEEAEERWGVVCAMAHRLGRVAAGECSVAIAVASPHRAEGFEACRWLMDMLKESVPIWKKEYFEGGAHWIEGAQAIPSPSASTDSEARPIL